MRRSHCGSLSITVEEVDDSTRRRYTWITDSLSSFRTKTRAMISIVLAFPFLVFSRFHKTCNFDIAVRLSKSFHISSNVPRTCDSPQNIGGPCSIQMTVHVPHPEASTLGCCRDPTSSLFRNLLDNHFWSCYWGFRGIGGSSLSDLDNFYGRLMHIVVTA